MKFYSESFSSLGGIRSLKLAKVTDKKGTLLASLELQIIEDVNFSLLNDLHQSLPDGKRYNINDLCCDLE